MTFEILMTFTDTTFYICATYGKHLYKRSGLCNWALTVIEGVFIIVIFMMTYLHSQSLWVPPLSFLAKSVK